MESGEAGWHRQQSERIRAAGRAAREAEHTIAFGWWECGQRLNTVYGESFIPFAEMEEICGIYQVTRTVITNGRRFQRMCPSRELALAVIGEYGTWSGIIQGYFRGSTAKQARESGAAAPLRMPGALFRDLTSHAHLKPAEARDAVRVFLENASWREIGALYQAQKRPRLVKAG